MKVIEILESQPFEFAIRILLYIIYYVTDDIEPFQREIQPEEMWLYKYPDLTGYISVTFLWTIVYLAPALAFTIYYIKTKNRRDLIQAVLGILLSVYLTASITNTIKLIVGRPRPNFFWRCFPDGKYNLDILCTGDLKKVADGRKSFPSGHSSGSICFTNLCCERANILYSVFACTPKVFTDCHKEARRHFGLYNALFSINDGSSDD